MQPKSNKVAKCFYKMKSCSLTSVSYTVYLRRNYLNVLCRFHCLKHTENQVIFISVYYALLWRTTQNSKTVRDYCI